MEEAKDRVTILQAEINKLRDALVKSSATVFQGEILNAEPEESIILELLLVQTIEGFFSFCRNMLKCEKIGNYEDGSGATFFDVVESQLDVLNKFLDVNKINPSPRSKDRADAILAMKDFSLWARDFASKEKSLWQ